MTLNLDTIYQAINSLHNNPDPVEKRTASLLLDELQKSVYAWKLADEILHHKKDLQLCFFAAQTLRKKIQNSFQELPEESQISLRDSLLVHVAQINKNASPIIETQLCLALSDLILQTNFWNDPIKDLIQNFNNVSNIWSLLLILTVLPEELNSRYLKLGEDRKKHIDYYLNINGNFILEFLVWLVNEVENTEMYVKVLKCFTTWIKIRAISFSSTKLTTIITLAFKILQNHRIDSELHDAATDCVTTILLILEEDIREICDPEFKNLPVELQQLQSELFSQIAGLETIYKECLTFKEMNKLRNYSRLFVELAESFLDTIIYECSKEKNNYIIKVLDLVLMITANSEYNLAEITFNFWYKLSDILYKTNNKDFTSIFAPFVENLIVILCELCRIDTNQADLFQDVEFLDFRAHVSELLKDIVFIVGARRVFQHILSSISNTSSWDFIESRLFILQTIANKISLKENEIIPRVVEGILNLPENTHVAVRYTSIVLFGELRDWINNHPDSLERILQFLSICFSKPELGNIACKTLQKICIACTKYMKVHLQGLLQIARFVDFISIDDDAVIHLLNGISKTLSQLSDNEVEEPLAELCRLQVKQLYVFIQQNPLGVINTNSSPILSLNRLAALFKHVTVRFGNCDSHFYKVFFYEIWPILSSLLNTYQHSSKIMESCCRTLRYIIPSLGKYSCFILKPLIEQIIGLYSHHKFSCFLYLGATIIDIFGSNKECISDLIIMLKNFIESTFKVLQEIDGPTNHPDIVEDFFRLCSKFLQNEPISLLSSSMMDDILRCAFISYKFHHEDATSSITKFFCYFLRCGLNNKKQSDFKNRRELVEDILYKNGATFVNIILQSAVFSLPIYVMSDIAEIIFDLLEIHRESTIDWLKQAASQIPTSQNDAKFLTASPCEVTIFQNCIIQAENSKSIERALKDLKRSYR